MPLYTTPINGVPLPSSREPSPVSDAFSLEFITGHSKRTNRPQLVQHYMDGVESGLVRGAGGSTGLYDTGARRAPTGGIMRNPDAPPNERLPRVGWKDSETDRQLRAQIAAEFTAGSVVPETDATAGTSTEQAQQAEPSAEGFESAPPALSQDEFRTGGPTSTPEEDVAPLAPQQQTPDELPTATSSNAEKDVSLLAPPPPTNYELPTDTPTSIFEPAARGSKTLGGRPVPHAEQSFYGVAPGDFEDVYMPEAPLPAPANSNREPTNRDEKSLGGGPQTEVSHAAQSFPGPPSDIFKPSPPPRLALVTSNPEPAQRAGRPQAEVSHAAQSFSGVAPGPAAAMFKPEAPPRPVPAISDFEPAPRGEKTIGGRKVPHGEQSFSGVAPGDYEDVFMPDAPLPAPVQYSAPMATVAPKPAASSRSARPARQTPAASVLASAPSAAPTAPVTSKRATTARSARPARQTPAASVLASAPSAAPTAPVTSKRATTARSARPARQTPAASVLASAPSAVSAAPVTSKPASTARSAHVARARNTTPSLPVTPKRDSTPRSVRFTPQTPEVPTAAETAAFNRRIAAARKIDFAALHGATAEMPGAFLEEEAVLALDSIRAASVPQQPDEAHVFSLLSRVTAVLAPVVRTAAAPMSWWSRIRAYRRLPAPPCIVEQVVFAPEVTKHAGTTPSGKARFKRCHRDDDEDTPAAKRTRDNDDDERDRRRRRRIELATRRKTDETGEATPAVMEMRWGMKRRREDGLADGNHTAWCNERRNRRRLE